MTSLLARPDVLDQFGRTVASGWGTADTGQAWTVNSTTTTYVAGGRGVMDPTAANQSVNAGLVSPAADFDIAVTCYLPETPSGSSMNAYLTGRADLPTGAGPNRYELLAGFTTTGTVTVNLRSVVGGAGNNLVALLSNATYTPGDGLNLRLRCIGSTISGKAWIAGTPEPAWSSVVNTSITAAGYLGVGLFRNSGNTSTDDRLLFDNFSCRALYPNVVDSFSRTVGDSWRASDSGHGWVLTGTASDFLVAGGQGWITPGSTNSTRAADISFAHYDVDSVADLGVAQVQTGASAQQFLVVRNTSGVGHYRVVMVYGTDGNVSASLQRLVSGVGATTIVSNFVILPYSAGQMFRVRLQCIGATLRAKVWPVGDPEPSSWQGTATDSTFAGGTTVAVQAFRTSGNTSVDASFLFDNFFVRPLRPGINDSFDRTVASGWGNLTSGQAWAPSDSTKVSVGSGRGSITADANTTVGVAVSAPSADYEVRTTVDIPQTQTGASTTARIFARASNAGNNPADRYDVSATFTTDGLVTIDLRKLVSSSVTTLANLMTNVAYTPGTGINLRLRCVGSKISAKAWFVGSAEPAWSEVQDTSHTAAGYVQCNTFRPIGNTSTDGSVYYDDFQVIDLSRPLRLDTGVTSIDPARLVTI